jgi:hypothetical protein
MPIFPNVVIQRTTPKTRAFQFVVVLQSSGAASIGWLTLKLATTMTPTLAGTVIDGSENNEEEKEG